MRTFAYLCSALFLVSACGGDDSSSGDDVVEPDAEPGVDAEIEPDADTSCTTDPLCVGETAGATLCNGSAIVTCVADGDCLDAMSAPCDVGDICVDTGTPACETPATSGDSCATALAITADTTLSGADFTADYANDHDFTDATCDGADPDTTNSEAVFSVALTAGQRVVVESTNGLDTVMGIQSTCGDAGVCSIATDDPDIIGYVAETAETVFIYVGTYALAPASPAYELAFDLSECGDGILDVDFEECDDDGVAADDGCSAECAVEFGYACDEASPTVCTAFPDLGSFGTGATISYTGGALAADESAYVTVTFTAPVRVSGTVAGAGGVGDPDVLGYTPTSLVYVEDDVGATETFSNLIEMYYPAGEYVFRVVAYGVPLTGYTINLTTAPVTYANVGSFAAGAAISPLTDSDGMTAAQSAYFEITFTTPVLLDGTLTSGTGDMDLYWWNAGDIQFFSATDGNQTFTDELLPAGTYSFVTNAYYDTGNVDTYTLSLSTTAPPP